MKGTNLRRILCILLTALLCVGLLPMGSLAEGYAAELELRTMQKTRREVDSELLKLENGLRSDLTAAETVDKLAAYLENDPRIKSVDRQSDTTFGYTFESGMTVVYDYNIMHGIRENSEPIELDLAPSESVREILDDDAVSSTNRNIAVYSPYFGIDVGFADYYPVMFANAIKSYTGGTVTVYGGNCEVSTLREMHNYGVIMFDSHGLEYQGLSYIAFNNENGVTAEDYSNGYVVGLSGGGVAVNYLYLNRYATGTMPGSYVHLTTCSGGKDGHLLNYFISHGASAATGYDDTVTVAYDLYIFQDIVNSMRGLEVSETYNLGQAFDYAKERRGEYDPYSYEDEGIYARPVLVGNRNWYFPPIYTVSFFVDGMNNPYETYTVTQNSSLNVNDFPTPPAIGGMEFSHWKTRGGTVISGSVTVNSNVDIIAVYTTPKCTVQWVDSVTGETLKTERVSVGETITRDIFPTPAEHVGKEFLYWSVNGDEFFGSSYYVQEDTTFRAEYSNASFEVNFYSSVNGNSLGSRTVEYGTQISLSEFPQAPTTIGYSFVGWQDEDGNPVSESVTITGNANFYAVYEPNNYTVTFYDNRTNVTLSTVTVPFGTEIALEDFPEHTEYYGWDFLGWFAYGAYVTDKITVINDVKVFATYEQHTFTVTFVDGYTGETILTKPVRYQLGIYYDMFPEAPVHEGTDFLGWYVYGVQFTGRYLEVTGDTTVTATYRTIDRNTITLIDSLTGEIYDTVDVRSGSTVELADLPMPPYREGVSFVGWYLNGERIETDSIVVNEDITITAELEIMTFTVKFYDHIADEFFAEIEGVEYNTELTLNDFPEPPVHDGMEFFGWNYNGQILTEDSVITVTQPVVVTAVYAPRTCRLTVIDDYTGETLLDRNVECGLVITVSEIPAADHEGMVFVGWFINGELVTDETIVVETDLVLHAVYEPEPPAVGDIDGDGAIEMDDALMLMRYAMGTENLTEEQITRADVNGDGVVDIFDALMALRMALGSELPSYIKPRNIALKTER